MARKTPEGRFKESLTKRLESLFPGCVILKNDEQLLQGVPDMLILWEKQWAMLEVKRSANAERQPNQGYYVDLFNSMSYAAFIYPENEEEILSELQRALSPSR